MLHGIGPDSLNTNHWENDRLIHPKYQPGGNIERNSSLREARSKS